MSARCIEDNQRYSGLSLSLSLSFSLSSPGTTHHTAPAKFSPPRHLFVIDFARVYASPVYRIDPGRYIFSCECTTPAKIEECTDFSRAGERERERERIWMSSADVAADEGMRLG